MNAGDRLTREQWSDYWRKATVTTFHGHFETNYDREIREFWWRQFDRLSRVAPTVVDVATGNGAVALLAVAWGRERKRPVAVTAIDAADIRPTRDLSGHRALREDLDRIRFLGQTPMEATGLPDAQTHLVTSQYGLEYGDRDAALGEVARILRPGGRAAFLIHHADSAVLRQAREGLALYRLVMDETKLLHLAEPLLARIAAATTAPARAALKGDPVAERQRRALNAAVEHVTAKAEGARDAAFVEFVLRGLSRLLSFDAGSRAEREQGLSAMRHEAESFRLRMTDLLSAALDENAFEALIGAAARQGLVLEARGEIVYANRDLMAWSLELVRGG
jgi:ubiquinone/menaquinone biosynthesis C-methylase UbiE